MQFKKLIIATLAILLCCSSSVLLGQTYKQQLKSTAIINTMFGKKLKFIPKNTRKITASQLQKDIQANDLIPAHLRDEVYNNLIPTVADIKDVRIIVAEATADCGDIEVFMVSISDTEGNISGSVQIFIPPHNKCGKLIEALSPALYNDFFGGKKIKVVKSKSCRSFTDEIALCADVLLFVPDEDQVIYSVSDCDNNSDCSKVEEKDKLIVIWDLMMENN